MFIGTLYPLALEALTGDKISVGAPFFNLTFGPLFVPLLLAVPFGPMLAWKRGDLLGVAQRLTAAGIAALIAIARAVALDARRRRCWRRSRIGLAVLSMAGALTDLAERTGAVPRAVRESLRARARPAALGLGHRRSPMSASASRCSASSARPPGTANRSSAMKPGERRTVAGYELTFDGMAQRQGPNYRELIAQFTVSRDGERSSAMDAVEAQLHRRGRSSTTEAALLTRGFSQLYLSLGEPEADGAIAVRVYHKPLVLLIWLGAVVMAFGGALSLSDRRLRVGAPKPRDGDKRALQPAE